LGLGGASLGALALPGCREPIQPVELQPATDLLDMVVVSGGGPAENTLRALRELGGIQRFVSRGDVVTIKPNFYMGHPADYGTTTDPEVVRVVCEQCLAAGARRIVLVDKFTRKTLFDDDALGISRMMADLQHTTYARLADERLFRDLDLGRRFELERIGVARLAYECDVLINLPVGKSHGSVGVSFALKNLMGLIQEPEAWHSEYDLHRAIADFGEHFRPALTLVDLTRGLLTGGPNWGGEVGDLRTVVAGIDPVAIDACCTGLAAWNGQQVKPEEVAYLRHAAELGAGSLDWERSYHKVVRL
jgi:uncharacterized protein (DUF362 family)